MKIPCKNCLILPMCREKVVVSCGLLSDAADTVDGGDLAAKKWWNLVNKHLPKAITIIPDNYRVDRDGGNVPSM